MAKRHKLTPGPGRPSGSRNKISVEARAACAAIVDDPAYRAKLLARARSGRLSPAVEVMLWYFAKGRPRHEVEITGALRHNVGTGERDINQMLAEYEPVFQDLAAGNWGGPAPARPLPVPGDDSEEPDA